jgi:hypothetical protein
MTDRYPDYTPNRQAAAQLDTLSLEITSNWHGTIANGVVIARSMDSESPCILIGIGKKTNRAAAIALLKAGIAELEAPQPEDEDLDDLDDHDDLDDLDDA